MTKLLQVGDRIVEVEGENVSLENHSQVVSRIAGAGLALTMLVVDRECEEFHRARNIVITSSLPHTVRDIVITINISSAPLYHLTRRAGTSGYTHCNTARRQHIHNIRFFLCKILMCRFRPIRAQYLEVSLLRRVLESVITTTQEVQSFCQNNFFTAKLLICHNRTHQKFPHNIVL